jgi:Cd2+/Zn2+-exporting ATPase
MSSSPVSLSNEGVLGGGPSILAPEVEAQATRVSVEILATLVGGTLLLSSVAARWLFDNEFYPGVLGMLSAVLLGSPLVWSAVKDLMRGHTHMNELVALAVLAAFAIGSYQEAAAIAFFMLISALVESRTALGAQASIESLIRITPTRAYRLTGGVEEEVDPKGLRPGDVVRVRPGDNIPADGRVRLGASTVNQATVTGESIPAEKAEGDEVFGGTINLTGVMEVEVTKAGRDTTLGRVQELILQAERTRAPIMRTIDEYATWYTPTVLMLVGVILFFTLTKGLSDPWGRAISMLVVACPCPLILATPTAMVAALSAAARLGVLVKSVVDLEGARDLTAVIFDKTGTLTTGELKVTRLSPAAGVDGADLLRTAGSVGHMSRHPVARAVAAMAKKARVGLPEAKGFAEVSGQGLRAVVEGRPVLVGRASWLMEGSGLTAETKAEIEAAQGIPEAEGLSMLFVLRDGGLLGWIGLEDDTRPEAAAAMDRLREQGLKRLVIVTGDRESVAKRVAEQMHTEYRAQVLPHEKLEMVAELKRSGHRVAVVGDGVNDAPALAAGDISIAMGAAGSDVAIHSANIALMNNNLNRVPFLVGLSRETNKTIRQNLAVGMGFMGVFVALSAAGYVTPVVAAALHLFSILVVVFNSARLVRAGEDIERAEAGLATGVIGS